jgi:hypothetical protein
MAKLLKAIGLEREETKLKSCFGNLSLLSQCYTPLLCQKLIEDTKGRDITPPECLLPVRHLHTYSIPSLQQSQGIDFYPQHSSSFFANEKTERHGDTEERMELKQSRGRNEMSVHTAPGGGKEGREAVCWWEVAERVVGNAEDLGQWSAWVGSALA